MNYQDCCALLGTALNTIEMLDYDLLLRAAPSLGQKERLEEDRLKQDLKSRLRKFSGEELKTAADTLDQLEGEMHDRYAPK